MLVDSTGIKFLGDGEWLARKHGTHRRRQYRKIHLAMDTATGDIRGVEFTSTREGDSPVLPDLLDQIPADEQIGTVTGDSALAPRRCHTAISDRGGTAIIPIRKNGRLWKEDCLAARARNDILRTARRFGRANWEALVRLSCPKSNRGKDALPQTIRRADRLARPGQAESRNPHPRRPHEPLQRTRHCRDQRVA